MLEQLHTEVTRLFIAGSDLAAGDTKLKKFIPQLTKMGEKSPVFTKLATLTQHLVDGENNAEQLLQLGQLLNSILYTHGRIGFEGDIVITEGQPCETKLRYNHVNAIVTALTTTGSGRYETVIEAHKNNQYQDSRLLPYFIKGLQDKYSELADYICEYIIPTFPMEKIVLILEASFNPKGKSADVRKLRLLAKFKNDPAFLLEVLDKSSSNVKEEVITQLGQYPNMEDILIEQTKSKQEAILYAAYSALTQQNSQKARIHIVEGLFTKHQDIVSRCIWHNGTNISGDYLLPYIKRSYANFSEDPSEQTEEHFAMMIGRLQESSTLSIDTIEFLKELPEKKISVDILDMVLKILLNNGQEQYVEQLGTHPPKSLKAKQAFFISYAFDASLKLNKPNQLFELYAPFVEKGRQDKVAKALLQTLDLLFTAKHSSSLYPMYSAHCIPGNNYTWDERWLSLLMKLTEKELVFKMTTKIINAEHLQLILQQIDNRPELTIGLTRWALYALTRAQHKAAIQVLYRSLQATDKLKKGNYYPYAPSIIFDYLTPKQQIDTLAFVEEQLTQEAWNWKAVVVYALQEAIGRKENND